MDLDKIRRKPDSFSPDHIASIKAKYNYATFADQVDLYFKLRRYSTNRLIFLFLDHFWGKSNVILSSNWAFGNTQMERHLINSWKNNKTQNKCFMLLLEKTNYKLTIDHGFILLKYFFLQKWQKNLIQFQDAYFLMNYDSPELVSSYCYSSFFFQSGQELPTIFVSVLWFIQNWIFLFALKLRKCGWFSKHVMA